MTWRAAQRAVVAVGATLLLGIGVAGCSDDYQYAATIDGDGHVIVTWCSGAVPVIQVTPAGGLLDHKATNTSPHRVDLADSGAEWSVTGDITITDDSTITLWSEHSAPRPSRSTASVSSTSTTNSTTIVDPPRDVFHVRDLRHGRYLHHDELISSDQWSDICHPLTLDRISLIVPAILGLLCFVGVLALIVTGMALFIRSRKRPA